MRRRQVEKTKGLTWGRGRSMGTKRRVGEEKMEDKEQTETEGDATESAEMR